MYFMRKVSFLVLTVSLFSCVHSTALYFDNQTNYRLAYKSYYSPCCGWCGRKIILDSLKGQQNTLFIDCNINHVNNKYCTYLGIGTQKHIDTYNGNFIRSRSIYIPVYDTVELKKNYPDLDREIYFNTSMLSINIIPLIDLDSLIIKKSLEYTGDTACDKMYLKYIRGYVLVKTESMKIKKERL